MNFVYLSRLEHEKGFDLLVKSLQSFGELPGNFFIFGDGSMRKNLFEVFSWNPIFSDCSKWSEEKIKEILKWDLSKKRIYFFSFQSKERIIDPFFSISHFSLMPSRFLETFGLSALESLAAGVPVIGFRKWGLVPFIEKDFAIEFWSDTENAARISEKIEEVSRKYQDASEWKKLSQASRGTAGKYSEERWIEETKAFLPEGTKRILLVSDYISLLGGIETHVATIASTLKKQGYEVDTCGWNIPKNRFTRILRRLGLVVSGFNLPFALKLRKKIQDQKPDVIWLHAVSRFLGPLAVREATNSGVFTCITYHDLGMWTPFPSRMEREEDVSLEWNLWSFLSVTKSFNIITHTAIFFKFLWISFLRSEIQKVYVHLIPSEFMRKYVQHITEISDEHIITLEHFQK